VPMTLVPSSEAEAMSNVASSIAASLGLEQGVHGTEFVTGVTSDGSQAIYVMDTSQPAVEVDMSEMGLTAEGAVLYDADDPNSQQQFIVQDIHGNQFRKVTGIDESGKPVIFFQITEEHEQVAMTPTILQQQDMSTDSSNGQQQTQVILTTADGNEHEATVYDLVPEDQDSSDGQVHHIVTPISESSASSSSHMYKESNHQDTTNVQQQLHIVLDQNNESGGGHVNGPESFEHEQGIIEEEHEEDTVMVIEEEGEEQQHPASDHVDHDADTQLIETGSEEQEEEDTHENQEQHDDDDDMELIEAEVMQ